MAKKLNGARSRGATKKKGGGRPAVRSLEGGSAGENGEQAQTALNLPKKRDLLHHYKSLEGSLARIHEARATHANLVKAAQEAGIDTKAMLFALRSKNKDDLAVRMYFNQLAAILAETGSPVQLSIFEPRFGSGVEQAKSEGYAAGKNGDPSASRFPENSPEDHAYKAAWTKGQAELAGAAPA